MLSGHILRSFRTAQSLPFPSALFLGRIMAYVGLYNTVWSKK